MTSDEGRTAMRTFGQMRAWLALAVAAAGGMAGTGCELLVDFDRSKIPQGDVADVTVPGSDSQAPVEDGGSDATLDASDASPGADGSAAPDAPTVPDGTTDAAADGSADASMALTVDASDAAAADASPDSAASSSDDAADDVETSLADAADE
jgi:hypothetical protein